MISGKMTAYVKVYRLGDGNELAGEPPSQPELIAELRGAAWPAARGGAPQQGPLRGASSGREYDVGNQQRSGTFWYVQTWQEGLDVNSHCQLEVTTQDGRVRNFEVISVTPTLAGVNAFDWYCREDI